MVSLVGVGLSLFGLLVTVACHLIISIIDLKLNKPIAITSELNHFSIMSQQFLNLTTTWCLSLVAMNVFYIVMATYSDRADSYENLNGEMKGSCIFIGVMLHYFLLASFFFSLSISIIKYLISFSLRYYSHVYLKAVLFSFGIIPLFI